MNNPLLECCALIIEEDNMPWITSIENPPASRGGRMQRAALGTGGGRRMSSTGRKKIKNKIKKKRIKRRRENKGNKEKMRKIEVVDH